MTAPQQPGREQEIRARASAATPGPWSVEQHAPTLSRLVVSNDHTLSIDFGYVGNRTQADAEFTAHAREDVDWLLDRITELHAEVGRAISEGTEIADGWEAECKRLRADRDAAVAAAVRRALGDAADEHSRLSQGQTDDGHNPLDRQHATTCGQCVPAMQVAPYPPSSSWHVQVRLVDTWAIARTGAQSLAAAREREASVVEQTGRQTRILREDTSYALEARTELPAREQGEEAAR